MRPSLSLPMLAPSASLLLLLLALTPLAVLAQQPFLAQQHGDGGMAPVVGWTGPAGRPQETGMRKEKKVKATEDTSLGSDAFVESVLLEKRATPKCTTGTQFLKNNKCVACTTVDSDAKTCSTTGVVTACKTKFLYNKKCVTAASCPTNTYPNTTKKTCAFCSTLFTGSNKCTATAATGCASPYFLSGSACTKTCPSGTYGKAYGRVCVACSTTYPGAVTCSASAALTCSSGFVLASGKCQCAAGRFLNTATKKCDACTTKFSYSLTCTANEALTCRSPRVVINKVCALPPTTTTTVAPTTTTATTTTTTTTTPPPTSSSESTSTDSTSSGTSSSSSSSSSSSQTLSSSSSSVSSSASPTSSSSRSSTTSSSRTTTTTSRTTTTTSRTTTTTSRTTTTTSTRPTDCAATYSVASMIRGTGTLPKPTSFVKRSGQGLSLDGQNYRIAGPNIYWLCSDENVAGVPKGTPPDKSRVREALAIGVAMGANTVRIHTCGISVGTPYSVEPTLGSFPAAQWDIVDYVIFAAGQYGLRVILPLTDNHDYYHGGKYTFLRWRGVSTANGGAAFYTDSGVIASYKSYIKQMLTRKNPYTGLAYGRDPTIMAWETGNELGGYIGAEGYPPAAWTTSIALYIKSLAPNQLTIDGSNGFYNYTNKATAPGLNIESIDIVSDHGYPRNIDLLNSQIPLASNANKHFFLGEIDWTNPGYGTDLPSYLSRIESTPYMGSMMWSVMGHDSQCCKFVPHNDGYSMYYPNGNSADLQNNALQIVQHYYRLTGRSPPSQLPGVVCPQPVF